MNVLQQAREREGLSKAEVARRAGINRSHYGRVEAGKIGASYDLAKNLSAIFNRRVSEIQILELPAVEQVA